jgi:hypothetical protein
MLEGVKVSLSDIKDEIIIQGNDIEKVSQSAASITDKTRVKEKDVSSLRTTPRPGMVLVSALAPLRHTVHIVSLPNTLSLHLTASSPSLYSLLRRSCILADVPNDQKIP